MNNVTVGTQLNQWREGMSGQLRDGSLSQLEQQCLGEFLEVPTNLRPYLVQCYDQQDFPRTNNDMECSIRGLKTQYRRVSGHKNWNAYLLRYGRSVAYAAWWEQTARLDRVRWRQLRRESSKPCWSGGKMPLTTAITDILFGQLIPIGLENGRPLFQDGRIENGYKKYHAEDTRRDPHGSPKTTTEARDNFCDKKFRPKTMYLAKISAKDNVSGKKLISNETLVGTGTIFVARFSKNSGLKGSPGTIFVAKMLHKDNFCDNLHTQVKYAADEQEGVEPCDVISSSYPRARPKTN